MLRKLRLWILLATSCLLVLGTGPALAEGNSAPESLEAAEVTQPRAQPVEPVSDQQAAPASPESKVPTSALRFPWSFESVLDEMARQTGKPLVPPGSVVNCDLWPPACECSCLNYCQETFESCYANCNGNFICQWQCLIGNSCCVDVCCGDIPQHCT